MVLGWVTFLTLDFPVHPTNYGLFYYSGYPGEQIFSANHVGTQGLAFGEMGVGQLVCAHS